MSRKAYSGCMVSAQVNYKRGSQYEKKICIKAVKYKGLDKVNISKTAYIALK